MAHGDELRLTVDDSAPGVSAADLARLGERFFRTEAARARQLGGAGIGLSLSRHLTLVGELGASHAWSIASSTSPQAQPGLRMTAPTNYLRGAVALQYTP